MFSLMFLSYKPPNKGQFSGQMLILVETKLELSLENHYLAVQISLQTEIYA